MTDCRDMELLLQDYLDGYLLTSQREHLEDHLRACPSCSGLLGELRRLDGNLVDFPQVEETGDLTERILAAIPEQPRYRGRRLFPGGHTTRALAAAAVVLVGFFFGARYGLERGTASRTIEIAFHAPAASSVAVVGDFNEWDSRRHRMQRAGEDGVWRVRLKLGPGIYEYGFLVDGRDWSKDPRAEKFHADGFGGENSVLFVEG